jgi:HD-like signal output (HDOD) protein
VKELCETGVEVGVLGFVLARHTRAALPDTALLAGLVSGMGKLYILTRAEEFPVLFANSWTRRELFQSWHAQLAGHVLENWQMPPEIIDAVAGMDRAGTETREAPKLADVLACAQLIREMQQRPDELALALIASQAAQRLLLTPEVCDGLLEESLSERAQLASALTY